MSERTRRSWVSPLVSVVALIVSVIALWYSVLAPADVAVNVSSPMFRWQPDIENPLSGAAQPKPVLMMEATCAFSNNGAYTGEISYLVLTLESDDGTRWLFAPYWIVDEAKLASDGFGKRTWMSGPFHGVVVPGKQTVAYSYMFVGESGLEHFQAPTLTAHKFRARLLTWRPTDNRPREQQTSTFDFDANLIANLTRGVMFGMPWSEQQGRVQSIR
jgi:hypothetical protein